MQHWCREDPISKRPETGFANRKERNCLRKKIGYVLFTAGIVMSVIGIPYLLGYSYKETLKYPLYAGLILTVAFAPLKAKWKRRDWVDHSSFFYSITLIGQKNQDYSSWLVCRQIQFWAFFFEVAPQTDWKRLSVKARQTGEDANRTRGSWADEPGK